MSGSGTKFLASALLSLTLLPSGLGAQTLSTGTASSNSRFAGANKALETEDDPPQDTHPPAEAHDPKTEKAPPRDPVSEALIAAAQNDFERVAKLSEDGYSKDLRKREAKLTKYLKKNNPDLPSAVYLDPNKFDTAMALGYTPEAGTQRLLATHKVKTGNAVLKSVAGSMKTDDDLLFAVADSYTQDPSANFDEYDPNPKACIVVPTASYNPEVQIKGLSFKENIEYVNGHEAWHCKDTKYSFAGISKEEFDKIKPARLEESLNSPDQLKGISVFNHKESLSDTAIVGDMIRRGGKIDLIDKIVAWRQSMSLDIMHYTVASLEKLKADIQKMGIENFRDLSDKNARKLYESVVDDTAMSPKMAEAIITYRKGDDDDRTTVRDAPQNLRTLDALMTTGQALRDGADPKTLDDAIAKVPGGDDKTKAALTALRDQVKEIGVERFRGLNDEDAQRISKALADSGGITGEMQDTVAKYWKAPPEEQAATRQELAEYLREVPRAMAFMKPYGEPLTDAERAALPNPFLEPSTPLSPLEQKVMKDLAAWDAGQLLEDRAFKKEGKITPQTLIHAYGAMQDDLRGQLKKHPEDPLLRAKVTKLQQSFIHEVQDTDYVAANAARGVNIFEKEASLTKFSQRQQTDASPGQAQHNETSPAATPAAEDKKQPDAAKPKAAVKPLQPVMGA